MTGHEDNTVEGVGVIRWMLRSWIVQEFDFVDIEPVRVAWDKPAGACFVGLTDWEFCDPVLGLRSYCEKMFLLDAMDPGWTAFWPRDGRRSRDALLAGPTLAELAEWIARRSQPIAIKPVSLLGRPSCCVGAFRMIQVVAEKVAPDVARFRPDTPITDRFTDKSLRTLWKQLRWRSENRLDPLIPDEGSRFGTSVGPIVAVSILVVVIGSVLFSYDDAYLNLFGTLLQFALWGCGVAIVIWLFARLDLLIRPRRGAMLPPGVKTFGDLAIAMAPKS